MKKLFYAVFVLSVCVSCASHSSSDEQQGSSASEAVVVDQEADQPVKEKRHAKSRRDLAIECVKRTLDRPSTMKVDSVCTVQQPDSQSVDTLYHVAKLNRVYEYSSGHATYKGFSDVVFDSLRQEVRTFPAVTLYEVYYQAKDANGNVIHATQSVVITSKGKAKLYSDYYEEHFNAPVTTQVAIERFTINGLPDNTQHPMCAGKWYNKAYIYPSK